MTLPNWITIGRLICIPFVVYYILTAQMQAALLFFVIAALSDAVDGFLARYMECKSDFGAALDPLADKLLFFFTFITLGYMHIIPPWLVQISIGRDLIIILGLATLKLYGIRFKIKPSLSSKFNTAVQSVVVITYLSFEAFYITSYYLHLMGIFLILINAISIIISGGVYAYIGLRLLKRRVAGVCLFAIFIGLILWWMPHIIQDSYRLFEGILKLQQPGML